MIIKSSHCGMDPALICGLPCELLWHPEIIDLLTSECRVSLHCANLSVWVTHTESHTHISFLIHTERCCTVVKEQCCNMNSWDGQTLNLVKIDFSQYRSIYGSKHLYKMPLLLVDAKKIFIHIIYLSNNLNYAFSSTHIHTLYSNLHQLIIYR